MNRESREMRAPDQKALTVCIKQHLPRMCQTRDLRLGSCCYRKMPGQNTLGCSGKSFSPYCFVNVSKRSSFAFVWKNPNPSNFSSLTLHQNKLWGLTSHSTDNQTSSASSELSGHNRNLIKYLLQTLISICHTSIIFVFSVHFPHSETFLWF